MHWLFGYLWSDYELRWLHIQLFTFATWFSRSKSWRLSCTIFRCFDLWDICLIISNGNSHKVRFLFQTMHKFLSIFCQVHRMQSKFQRESLNPFQPYSFAVFKQWESNLSECSYQLFSCVHFWSWETVILTSLGWIMKKVMNSTVASDVSFSLNKLSYRVTFEQSTYLNMILWKKFFSLTFSFEQMFHTVIYRWIF